MANNDNKTTNDVKAAEEKAAGPEQFVQVPATPATTTIQSGGNAAQRQQNHIDNAANRRELGLAENAEHLKEFNDKKRAAREEPLLQRIDDKKALELFKARRDNIKNLKDNGFDEWGNPIPLDYTPPPVRDVVRKPDKEGSPLTNTGGTLDRRTDKTKTQTFDPMNPLGNKTTSNMKPAEAEFTDDFSSTLPRNMPKGDIALTGKPKGGRES